MPSITMRQDGPGPQPGVRNIFSGVSIALGTGSSEQAASQDAASQANDAREAAMNADEAQVCPAPSDMIGNPVQETVGAGGFMRSFEANPDADLFVAFFFKEWVIRIRCSGDYAPGGLPVGVEMEELEHIEPLVCGETRTSGGVVLAKAVATSATSSLRAARDAAKARRDAIVADQIDRECPAGCIPEPEIVDQDEGGRAILLKTVNQARTPGSGGRRYVRFYAAWWTVQHRCVPAKEEKKKGRRYESTER